MTNSTYSTALTLWLTIQERFHKTAKIMPEQDLTLGLGPASIGYMLRHNAEVEYMFAEWFFGRSIPADVELLTKNGPVEGRQFTNLQELADFMTASNEHLLEGMKSLSEEAWHTPVNTPLGSSTPLEALGRLMYHTGIHAGQISQIQKAFHTREKERTH
ncbi:DinB family protein [Brevibacillus agri]|uniref:DinB family protein n=1 Tax=Brevibacillus agri TaxID=51101 RepID=UPI002E1EF6FF|nr:DinB family protein [Brevibacillus agri]